jgi:bidirectional [NiFe] hydrogenase diaphorase subunit
MNRTELLACAEQTNQRRKAINIHCCTSSGCQASQALLIKERLEQAVAEANLTDQVGVISVGCMGFCGQGPMVALEPQHDMFEHVTPDQAPAIIAALRGEATTLQRSNPNLPFFTQQLLVVRRNGGQIDPEQIDDYIAAGGYQALNYALHDLTPAQVIDEISQSGLRGRGGAGYPTGLKWATVAKSSVTRRFVVCNGDEGDPGAFMDRSILESDPHLVLEGMAIAAYAVGATQGYLYVRGEYPLAIQRLNRAILQAKKYGLLGTQIADTNVQFQLEVRIGAGAFVCGEETALIASIEGRRGQPRSRPPYPAEHGLWGHPTLINNVETFANIVPIISKGAEWYRSIGTATSKGTKVFALTGAIQHNGLIEVPMGMTLRTIIEELGGGVPAGHTVKAVQTGGPSGGCIPAALFDTPVDYESLAAVGSMMGSGGMVVLDDTTNMVELARFYMEFCMDESCGACVPCRVGTVQMHQLLSKIRAGHATQADLDLLRELCQLVRETSLCGLGQSAPNPVISTLRYFEAEYQAQIDESATNTQIVSEVPYASNNDHH